MAGTIEFLDAVQIPRSDGRAIATPEVTPPSEAVKNSGRFEPIRAATPTEPNEQ